MRARSNTSDYRTASWPAATLPFTGAGLPEDEWQSPGAELYLGHHRATQGRGLSPPRRLPDDHGHSHQPGTWCLHFIRIYLHDRAAVSLQRLVTIPGCCPLVGGTNRVHCCRDVTAKAIYDAIADHGVTHFGGAPIVLNMLINAPEDHRRAFDHVVEVFTAGAPPPAATLAAIEPLGFDVMQVYGLTETYGPYHRDDLEWPRMGRADAGRKSRDQGPHRGRHADDGRCHGDGRTHDPGADGWPNGRAKS